MFPPQGSHREKITPPQAGKTGGVIHEHGTEPDSERKVHAEPTQDDKPEPENGTHRELEPATRSARYALITAVSAAVISSFVAAGTAVYVSINQSNSSEQLAVTQAIRQDRQKVYSDFSVAMFSFMQQLGNVSGLLQARGSIESVRPEISELSGRQGEFLASLNLLLMAGSPEMQEVGGRFAEAVFAFSRDHVAPLRSAIHRGQCAAGERHGRPGAGLRGTCRRDQRPHDEDR